MKRYLFASVLVFFLAGCSSKVNLENEKNALLEADRAWAAAAAAGNVDQILPFWTDDAVIYFPGQPVVSGKEAISEFVTSSRSNPAFSISWTPQEARVAESGELGYTLGASRVSLPGPQGTSVTRNGNYLCIWRKQADGSWKCSVEISDFRPNQP